MRKIFKIIMIVLVIGAFVSPAYAGRKEKTRKKKKPKPTQQVHKGFMDKHPADWWYRYHYKNWKASHDDLLLTLEGNRPVRERNYNNALQALRGMQLFLPAGLQEDLDKHVRSLERAGKWALRGNMKNLDVSKARQRLDRIYWSVYRGFSYTVLDQGIFVKPKEYYSPDEKGGLSNALQG